MKIKMQELETNKFFSNFCHSSPCLGQDRLPLQVDQMPKTGPKLPHVQNVIPVTSVPPCKAKLFIHLKKNITGSKIIFEGSRTFIICCI